MFKLWSLGVLRHRALRIALAYTGVAMATALIALIGIFSVVSASSMTDRAISQVVVDWQVQPVTGADAGTVQAALAALPTVRTVQVVHYADVTALSAQTGGTVQTTGAAKVLGLSQEYRADFPGQMRLLLGDYGGVLLAQQTAANLHAGIGDTVQIARDGMPDSPVTVTGIVELPNADSLFQSVGAPKGAGPVAPPDNVVLLPDSQWTALFSGDTTHTLTQFHTSFAHATLPSYPDAAFISEAGQVRNFEAGIAGAAQVGDNLGARLDAVRKDAIYAKVIFLFLGLPAAFLAILLTISLLTADTVRKRRNEALLRMRGLDRPSILRLIVAEDVFGAVGAVLIGGVAAACLAIGTFGAGALSAPALLWLVGAMIGGVVTGLLSSVLPAIGRLRTLSVTANRAEFMASQIPLWQRLWLDLACLGGAAIIFWRSASSNYQVVLAPEGVTATAVDYTAFLSPLLFWVGAVLLTVRIASLAIRNARPALTIGIRKVGLASGTAPTIAASLSRQDRRIAGGIALVALAFSFAFATAIFNLTYDGQTRVDAMLTNGADVTITGTTATPVDSLIASIQKTPGVQAAVPMQHRFAYVGNDLQDIYGIDAARITDATRIVDSYFADKNAAATLAALQSRPDAVLLSQETVNDFQLALGDTVQLRLQDAVSHQYIAVPFTFVGVALEFPTAPKDSFIVANAAYIGAQTGAVGHEVLLVKAFGNPVSLAKQVQADIGPGWRVSDLQSTFTVISSSLTAVDLGRLTGVELTFAVLLLIGTTGMMIGLGFAERARTANILRALGASVSEVAGFLRAEALLILVPGAIVGTLIGVTAAQMLVKLLSGIFDPPPDALSYPIATLAIFVFVGTAAGLGAVWLAGRGRIVRSTGLQRAEVSLG